MISRSSGEILRLAFSKGGTHDFTLFKQSRLLIHPAVTLLADLGYIGAKKYHAQTILPHKSSKHQPLSHQQKQDNRRLSRLRIKVEHCFARLKRNKILCEKYRNRRSRFGLRCTLIAMIHNIELKSQ